ncbi:MAG: radical SAM protein [Gammaproteobacteria bacterium]|jgi:MoaA/NifB/PqqE/SkfB family radical SAM enzyme
MNSVPRRVQPLLNILGRKPVVAVFEVNLSCNSSCSYCSLPLNQGRYEMTRAEIRRVFSSLYDDGLRFVFVQGGEPTLRVDLMEIMGDLHEIGYIQTLVSNGTYITGKFVNRLKTMPINVTLSLDTLDRSRYRRIRGADQINQVLAAVNRLSSYPHPRFINCVVSDENKDEVMDVLHFARDHGFTPVVTPYHWNVGEYGKADPGLQYKKESVIPVFREILNSKLIPPGYLTRHVRDSIKWLEGGQLEACDAGRYSIAIDASGNVSPCQALPSAGNLLEMPLREILKRMDREAIRRCSDNSGCNLICNRLIGPNLRHPLKAAKTPDFIRTFSR